MSDLERIISMLPPSVSDLENDLEDGRYFKDVVFIQHIPDIVEKAQVEFIKICVDRGVLSKEFLDGKVSRQGIVGRYLDDSNHKDLYSLWYRFMCIDDDYKEWSQPYYAINFENYKDTGYSLNDNSKVKQYFRDLKISEVLDDKN
jgi:hypothetical protein